ncbi:hypothetical protein NQZ68_017778 [Dissostichus eleginoides]|nr:hypothetical protein NQZ68_017778 [Dissostichus eleginoides]
MCYQRASNLGNTFILCYICDMMRMGAEEGNNWGPHKGLHKVGHNENQSVSLTLLLLVRSDGPRLLLSTSKANFTHIKSELYCGWIEV